MPDVQLLTFFQISFLKKFCLPMSPEERETGLKDHTYGLLPAFLEGMLEGASGGTTIIDGNEPSYHYDSPQDFFEGSHFIGNTARYLIDQSLWGEYHRRVRTGQAVYVDEVMALRRPEHRGPAARMTEEERLLWLEHNFYWGLQTTDRYVWCYNEFLNWWDNGDITREEAEGMGMTWPRDCVPPISFQEALLSAKRKYERGGLLQIDLTSIMERVK
ncbi:MAG: hypothetical protein KC978_22980 [Candidatus Omnitrophica bacterium]|nr:hypothetical protein [Candidatus Omnitrophota bacterium]